MRTKPKKNSSKCVELVPMLLRWFAEHARDLQWRRTRDPYSIWVSEIMLQQTQVKTVIPYWERWMRELPTIESLAKAPPEKIHKLWEGLGYYTRVRNMQKAAQFIITNHNGRFPENFEDILALAGIGRYTAGAVCSIAFNQPTPILDGNVIRVLTRLFAISENPRDKATSTRLWQLAEELVTHAKDAKVAKENHVQSGLPLRPSRPLREVPLCSHLNQSLMELGALVCTPRSPRCLLCPVSQHCRAFQLKRVEDYPNLGKRIKITERRFAAFVVEHNGKILVRQRPAGVVNAHLWEFPNIEILEADADLRAQATVLLGFHPRSVLPLCTIRHSITRYRITLEAFTINGSKHRPTTDKGQWLTLADLDGLSFPSAHRKILNQIQKTL